MAHGWIVVVEARLMRVETMPEVGLGHGVERPVGFLEVLEDDPRPGKPVGGVAPYVEVAMHGTWLRETGALKPRVVVRDVGQYQLRDDPQPATVCLAQKQAEVPQCHKVMMHVPRLHNVIALIPERR